MKNPWLLPAGALVALIQLSAPAVASPDEVQALVRDGQFEQALSLADADLAKQPKDQDLRFLKGVALTELGRRAEAIEVFQGLTSDYPELPEPYNNLAVIYAQQDEFDKARAALEMAIRTHPTYATAHENLGDIYSRLASKAYSKAFELDGANAAAKTKLALVRQLISGGTPAAPSKGPAPSAVAVKSPAPVALAPAAAPTPAPAATSTPPKAPAASADVGEIEARVRAWADAWSRKDSTAYLSFYAPSFVVPGGRSRSTWENERRARVSKPGDIRVELEDIRVDLQGERATVSFRQHYDSYNFQATATKTLEMVRQQGRWSIQRELVGG
ncbi:MAG: tetratricopeptide repeat protein [Rhodocyclaceae bacterium]|nr:tetratricopeptide repeat protein [Rhodocyclaceae bacterium]